MFKVLVLTVGAHQQTVALGIRANASYQSSADVLKGRGHRVQLLGSKPFKFRVIRVEDSNFFLADLSAVLDHLLIKQGQFVQEYLFAVNDIGELALLQNVVLKLLQTLLDAVVSAVNARGVEA